MFHKPSLILLTAAALLLSGAFAAARLSAAPAASSAPPHDALLELPRAASAGQQSLFGHIEALQLKRGRFVMSFDPALWLTGLTAERAKGSKDVPNDYVIVDDSHRTLTYMVAKDATATILTHGTRTTQITVAELARRVESGRTDGAGFWIQTGTKYPSLVLFVDQQYQP